MDKKRIEITITLVLAAVLVFAWAGSITTLRQRLGSRPDVAPASTLIPATKATLPVIKPAVIKELPLEWVRCPFSGKIYSGKDAVMDFKLTGIYADEKGLHALINDEIVQAGATLGPYKVVKINADSVILNDGVNDMKLQLKD